MTCAIHGEQTDVQKLGEDFLVCPVKSEGNLTSIDKLDGNGSWRIAGICGEILFNGEKRFYHDRDKISGMGDCIQMTAFFQYVKRKFNGWRIVHKITGMNPNCAQIDPREYYPDGLVEFVTNDDYEKMRRIQGHNIATYNNWMWSGFLRDRGIYTDVKQRQSSTPKYDVVFIPLLSPVYNFTRGMERGFVTELHKAIQSRYPNSITILDKKKSANTHKTIVELAAMENVVLSDSMDETLRLITESKVFIGGDTGVTHFAGACKHKGMVLLYAPESVNSYSEGQKRQAEWYARAYNELGLLDPKYEYSSLPCCAPEQYTIVPMQSNQAPIGDVIKAIEERLC